MQNFSQKGVVQRRSPAGVVEWARTAPASQYYVTGGTLAVAPGGDVLVTGVGVGPMTFDALVLPPVSHEHYFVARLRQAASPAGTASTAPVPAWHLAPNPATTRVALLAPTGTGMVRAKLLDGLGRHTAACTGPAEKISFEVRTLPTGLYVVRATSAAGAWVGRLLKE